MKGFVYFIFAETGEDERRVKIGYTAGTPHSRMAALQCGSPIELRLAGYLRGTQDLERKFHDTFRNLRLHGEWFDSVGKLETFVNYLSFYGFDKRVTDDDEVESAIHDVICAACAPHPSIDDAWYSETGDASLWPEFVDA